MPSPKSGLAEPQHPINVATGPGRGQLSVGQLTVGSPDIQRFQGDCRLLKTYLS